MRTTDWLEETGTAGWGLGNGGIAIWIQHKQTCKTDTTQPTPATSCQIMIAVLIIK